MSDSGVGAVPADEPTGRTDEQIRADLTELDEPHLALDKAETYDRLLNDVEPLLARAVAAERRLAAVTEYAANQAKNPGYLSAAGVAATLRSLLGGSNPPDPRQ